MTELQKQALDFIKGRILTSGVAPSYAEVAAELGCKSRGSVHSLVGRLVADGHLVRRRYRTRGLSLPHMFLGDVPTARLIEELERRGWRQAA